MTEASAPCNAIMGEGMIWEADFSSLIVSFCFVLSILHFSFLSF